MGMGMRRGARWGEARDGEGGGQWAEGKWQEGERRTISRVLASPRCLTKSSERKDEEDQSEAVRGSFPRQFRASWVEILACLKIPRGRSTRNWNRIPDPNSLPLEIVEFGPEF
jgi:hypothetical protein